MTERRPKSERGTYEAVESLLRKHIRSGGRLLEVSGGAGLFCDRIRDLFGMTITSDIVPPERYDASAAVCLNANRRLPFRDESVNTVVCIEAIEHFDAQMGFLSECVRILKPSGWLVLSTPNILSLDERRRFFLEGVFDSFSPEMREDKDLTVAEFYDVHIGLMHPLVLRLLLMRSGLEIIEQTTNFMSMHPRHAIQRLIMYLHLWFRRRKYERTWKQAFPKPLERINADPVFLYGNSLVTIARKP